jgi:hypothetical protein
VIPLPALLITLLMKLALCNEHTRHKVDMNRLITVVVNEVAEVGCIEYAVFELKRQFSVQLDV